MTQTPPSVADKRRTFRQLHEAGCFIIPNPWDLGSARFLQALGYKALATTSSGFAWSQGRPDGGVSLGGVLEHLQALVASTEVPINADFESGFATDAAGVARNVRLALETGVSGLSIEDSTGDTVRPLYDLSTAVERIRAARKSIDEAGGDTLLVGRAECFLVGRTDVVETIARLKAYANAGADCLYAPGLRTGDQIAAVVAGVAPHPLNVLIGWSSELTVPDLAALGVRRVSVGGALARCAWGAFAHAATVLAQQGTFAGFADAYSGNELNSLFRQDTPHAW